MLLFTINDNVADKITKFASAKNNNMVNSIQNKFDNLCDLISKNVDIPSVAETKLDLSFPNPQF